MAAPFNFYLIRHWRGAFHHRSQRQRQPEILHDRNYRTVTEPRLRVTVNRLLVIILLSFAFAANSKAVEYYTASTGSDQNPGTFGQPFQTIARGAAHLQAGDTLWIRGGVYRETILPPLSGQPGLQIKFAAYGNENVTVTGCDIVEGWSVHAGTLWKATVGWDMGQGFNQVFVDGILMTDARHPNQDGPDLLHPTLAPLTVNYNTVVGAAFGNRPANFWAGGYFIGGIDLNFAWQTAPILASSGDNMTLARSQDDHYPWFDGSGKGFVTGVFAALDAPKEWFVQSGSPATLYLRTSDDSSPSGHLVELKRRQWCADLDGKNYITLKGIKFRAGAIRLKGNGNIVEDCDAKHLSHFQQFAHGYSPDGGTPSSGGLLIRGDDNIVRRCRISDTASCGVYVPEGNRNEISRCLIERTNYAGTYASCIWIGGNLTKVLFNTCRIAGRDIIQPRGSGNEILYNDFSEPGKLCKDLGIVYVWGVDSQLATPNPTRIAYNWVHDNLLTTPAPGIYIDNYCKNFVVDHNVIWNVPNDAAIRVNGPTAAQKIYHNTTFNSASIGSYTFAPGPPYEPFWTDGEAYSVDSLNNLELAGFATDRLVDPEDHDFRLKAEPISLPSVSNTPGGLRGEYFNNRYFEGQPVLSRIDATVDYADHVPIPGLNTDNVSIRWSGQIIAPATGTYVFYTTADNGVRLRIDGNLLIDWQNQAPAEHTVTLNLVANQKYTILMEYYEAGGDAVAQLRWAGPGITKQLIPGSQLYPSASPGSLPAIDVGSFISGMNEGFMGAAPDRGAYEFGGANWKAGIGGFAVGQSANPDSDNDSLPDEWEIEQWASLSAPDANSSADADRDGMTNFTEYVIGTNPRFHDPSRMTIQQSSGQQISLSVVLSAPTGPGYTGLVRFYDLESTTALNDGTWLPVAGYINMKADNNHSLAVTISPVGTARFYRLKVRLQ